MREIPLNLGLFAKVDDIDFDRFSRNTWYASPMLRSQVSKFYVFRKEGGRTIYLHRLIIGAERGEEVDHIDGNPLNNQRGNLRICSRRLNCANTTRRPGSSGYRGVYRYKRRFLAAVTVDGKLHKLGSFPDAVSAAKARDAAALKMYGEFAVLNFPVLEAAQ